MLPGRVAAMASKAAGVMDRRIMADIGTAAGGRDTSDKAARAKEGAAETAPSPLHARAEICSGEASQIITLPAARRQR
jgi:hypothetical protein